MRSTCTRKLTLALAGLLPGVLMVSLATPVVAEPAAGSVPERNAIAKYDATREITINGTVQQVITKHVAGSPAGMHLMVSGAQGLVDAHVGPYMSKSVKEALHMGLPLQIVGAMETVRGGKQYLLARQVIYGGQTLTVRNNRGMLLRPPQSSTSPRTPRIERSRLSGGAR